MQRVKKILIMTAITISLLILSLTLIVQIPTVQKALISNVANRLAGEFECEVILENAELEPFKGNVKFSQVLLETKGNVKVSCSDLSISGLDLIVNSNELKNATISNLEIYEWDILGLDWVIEYEPTYYGWGLKVVHGIEIERNSLYFLTKIFLPILIILGLSFSVMWIKPNQLQSRLTVSVVCFLALITYTFIIDKDLPKLDYLTVMDYIILVSYLFAAIPTIESVSISKQENNEKAEYIDRNYRILLPIIYISISCLIILTSIAFNLDNTKAFLN